MVPCSCLMIQTDKFTDKLNYVTIFFQDEINVETGHVNFTDLVILKYLRFLCLSSQFVVLQFS